MKTEVILATLLILIRTLTVRGAPPDVPELLPEDIKQIKDTLDTLCNKPSAVIRKAIKCVEREELVEPFSYEEYFGKWDVKHGKFGAVIAADIQDTEEVKVEDLTLKGQRGKKKRRKIKPTPHPVTWPVRVVVKLQLMGIRRKYPDYDFPTTEVERSNAIRLAAWKVGPRVYGIIILQDKSAKDYVSFEEYIVCERIDGWTLGHLFQGVVAEIGVSSTPAETHERQILDMLIVDMGGLWEVWRHDYRHCDPHAFNSMMRAFTIEECERMGESVQFDVIDKKCVIWNKKYLVFLDPSFMRKVEDDTRPVCGKYPDTKKDRKTDFFRTVQTWFVAKEDSVEKTLPEFAEKMDKAIGFVAEVSSPRDEYETYIRVLNNLIKLRGMYATTAEEGVKKLHRRVSGGRKRSRGAEEGYPEVPSDVRTLRRRRSMQFATPAEVPSDVRTLRRGRSMQFATPAEVPGDVRTLRRGRSMQFATPAEIPSDSTRLIP